MELFHWRALFADTVYPDDSDTTSLAMTILDDVSEEENQQARATIKANLNPDGLPYVTIPTTPMPRPLLEVG